MIMLIMISDLSLLEYPYIKSHVLFRGSQRENRIFLILFDNSMRHIQKLQNKTFM